MMKPTGPDSRQRQAFPTAPRSRDPLETEKESEPPRRRRCRTSCTTWISSSGTASDFGQRWMGLRPVQPRRRLRSFTRGLRLELRLHCHTIVVSRITSHGVSAEVRRPGREAGRCLKRLSITLAASSRASPARGQTVIRLWGEHADARIVAAFANGGRGRAMLGRVHWVTAIAVVPGCAGPFDPSSAWSFPAIRRSMQSTAQAVELHARGSRQPSSPAFFLPRREFDSASGASPDSGEVLLPLWPNRPSSARSAPGLAFGVLSADQGVQPDVRTVSATCDFLGAARPCSMDALEEIGVCFSNRCRERFFLERASTVLDP